MAARIARSRRRRQLALTGAAVIAGVTAGLAVYLSPAPVFSSSVITPAGMVAALLLVAGCSFVWIGTESRSLARLE